MSITHIPVEMRRLIRQRARLFCEYCRIPEAVSFEVHEIDHVVAEKHDGPTEMENLALACTICNQHKGTDLSSIDPETGAITPLFNPRRDRWRDHFDLEGGMVRPLSATGRVTIKLLRFNAVRRPELRMKLIVGGVDIVPP